MEAQRTSWQRRLHPGTRCVCCKLVLVTTNIIAPIENNANLAGTIPISDINIDKKKDDTGMSWRWTRYRREKKQRNKVGKPNMKESVQLKAGLLFSTGFLEKPRATMLPTAGTRVYPSTHTPQLAHTLDFQRSLGEQQLILGKQEETRVDNTNKSLFNTRENNGGKTKPCTHTHTHTEYSTQTRYHT